MLKGLKKMEKKFWIFGLIFSLIFLNLISAQGDWVEYGNSYSPLWHEEYGTHKGYLQTNYNSTVLNGYASTTLANTPFQPIVMFSGTSGYLIFPSANYLELYDSDLELKNEVLSGVSVGQIAVLDFSRDGISDDIAGLYQINSTEVALKVYNIDFGTFSFSKIFEQNFSVNDSRKMSGIRYSGGEVYFSATNETDTIFYFVNKTDSSSIILNDFDISVPIEPVSFFDMDNDGNTEYLLYNSGQVIIFNRDGTVRYFNSSIFTADIFSVRMMKADTSNAWRFAVMGRDGGDWNTYVKMIKLDGSQIWISPSILNLNYLNTAYGQMAVSDDYNGDNVPDIYLIESSIVGQSSGEPYTLTVLSGKTGSKLYYAYQPFGATAMQNSLRNSLTIADMDNSGTKSFIISSGNKMFIYNPIANTTLINTQFGSNYVRSCIPADLDYNGYLDVVCSDSGSTIVFYSSITNQNALIHQVAYDPSLYIQVHTSVYAYINASDSEGNDIYYSKKCFAGDNWSAPSLSSTQVCLYDSIGAYSFIVGAKDLYHSDYDTLSSLITVTTTGQVCNNNGICDDVLGETSANCPNDCPSVPSQNYTQAEGGMPIPLKIVDTENTEQGLLPEIYYGFLGFLSYTLSPMIILVFVIFFVMIMFAIGFIIKKFAKKVGDLK